MRFEKENKLLTEEEYKIHINDISNEEVPEVLFSVLSKVHGYLESISLLMNDQQVYKYSMFKVFYKQYNTVLALSKRSEYVFNPQASYMDIKSINILIRSMHEMYLLYTYLCSTGFFIGAGKCEELEFKSLAYQYSGENDNVRTFKLIKEIEHNGVFDESAEANAIERKSVIWSKILENDIYKSLPKKVKLELKKGNWKISSKGTLSWADLAKYSHLSKTYGVFEYHNMSLYAHSTFSSLQLEAGHDEDVDGLLCHCYILASVFSISVLGSFDKTIDRDGLISKRELALVYEFYGMGQR